MSARSACPLQFLMRSASRACLWTGVDTACNTNGVCPLHMAASNYGVGEQLCASLHKAGAKLNVADAYGMTPLHYAKTAKSGEDPSRCTWDVERRGEFSPLGPGAGCFLGLGSSLELVGTVPSRR